MARRPITVFSLSFLDVMACGLGATILFLVLISTQVQQRAGQASDALVERARALQSEVEEARRDLARRRAEAPDVTTSPVDPATEIERLRALIAQLEAQPEAREDQSVARPDTVEQLRADIRWLQEAKRRLAEATAEPAEGTRVRSFVGRGNRQYLTGMRMGGQRVLILVDASASMTARTYVNVVRYRAMPDARRRTAPKWRQAVDTVDWITTRLNPSASFQIYVFSEQARSVLQGTEGTWLSALTEGELDRAVRALREVTPAGGTSLVNAFETIGQLRPAPDNIFLITDGLPTQGRNAPSPPEEVREAQRIEYFNQAVRKLPRAPVNVILLPMDGDPNAAAAFWELARASRGSFLAPARDWP